MSTTTRSANPASMQTSTQRAVPLQARADLSGPVRTVASPIRMSVTPVAYDLPPPALGEHTDEVLDAI